MRFVDRQAALFATSESDAGVVQHMPLAVPIDSWEVRFTAKKTALFAAAGVGVALAYLSRRSGDGTVVAGYEGYQGQPMRVRNGLERAVGKAPYRKRQSLKPDSVKRAPPRRTRPRSLRPQECDLEHGVGADQGGFAGFSDTPGLPRLAITSAVMSRRSPSCRPIGSAHRSCSARRWRPASGWRGRPEGHRPDRARGHRDAPARPACTKLISPIRPGPAPAPFRSALGILHRINGVGENAKVVFAR
jgi:hypothetical protein